MLFRSEADQPYAAAESIDRVQYPRESNPVSNYAPRNWPVDLSRRGFRLPTEAEWEAAARGGTRTAYGFGSDPNLFNYFGWSTGNSGKQPHVPRALRPSLRGLFDMHGNVMEWTQNWLRPYSDNPYDQPDSEEGEYRTVRGGCWGIDESFCRSSERFSFAPSDRNHYIGMRLVMTLPDQIGRAHV